MNIEILKELKEAKYPLKKFEPINIEPYPIVRFDLETAYYQPSLSELLDAIGSRFTKLTLYPSIEPRGDEPESAFFVREDGTKSPYLKENRWWWKAVCEPFDSHIDKIKYIEAESEDRDEAVARLWIKLNNKNGN